MSKYKAGDKIVLEILQENYGDYKVGNETDAWWISSNHIDATAKPLSEYTAPLNDKIKRQAAEITRLLKENAELKEKLHEEHHELVWQDGYSQGISDEKEKWNENVKIIRDNAFEAGQVKGQNDAWKLAQKIVRAGVDGGFSNIEMLQIFDSSSRYQVLKTHQYAEAAANVEVWEKEEIKVGDIYSHYGIGNFVICDIDREKDMVKTLWDDLSVGTEKLDEIKKQCTKTGRHIDVKAMLAQIGVKSNGTD